MKEFTLMLLLLFAATYMGLGQTNPQPCNIAVGKNTVMAVYPDQAEFLLLAPYDRLLVVTFDEHSQDSTKAYVAKLSKLAPDIYRAEVAPNFWVEVYVATGTTIFSNGSTQVFFRPRAVGKE